MKFTWIYILSCVVVIASCTSTSEEPPPTSDTEEDKDEAQEHQETLFDLADLGAEGNDLPILPPIILLKFTNGTNLTSEEKAKRTINGNLGYGYQGNNLFSGKYNYYFPAGKTGTTVSIEESISPFLPTTIIEKVNPVSDKLYNPIGNSYPTSGPSNLFGGSNSNGHLQSQFRINPTAPVFGQRTKLQKTTAGDFQHYTRTQPTQQPTYASYTTLKPDIQGPSYTSGLSLGSYNNPSASNEYLPTPRPSFYNNVPQQRPYNSGSNLKQNYEAFSSTRAPPTYNSLSSGLNFGSYNNQRPGVQDTYSTPKPQSYPSQSQTTVLSALGNSPRYTYENGIKYEHKIVWKYPDGMVSEVGPSSYDANSYSPPYVPPTKISPTSNYQSTSGPSNFPKTVNSGYSVNAGSIYSQRPATFPEDDSLGDVDSKPNQFVSSASISNGGDYLSGSPAQLVRPSDKYSFQNPYSLNKNYQSVKSQNSPSSSSANQAYKPIPNKGIIEDPKSTSSYPVDSPEAEYPPLRSHSGDNQFVGQDGSGGSSFTSSSGSAGSYGRVTNPSSQSGSGKITSAILSKYSPQVQQYLKKALGSGGNRDKQKYIAPSSSGNIDSYSNLQYSNLLDYNPSISQYISNPSSILNAQPTFVQAGNSLIPVIILRVDGAPPIQPKIAPNINLRALLQNYLTQYAQTVNNLGQGKNVDQGYRAQKTQDSGSSELYDLGQLSQSLTQLGQGTNFKQNFAQNFAESVAQSSQTYQPTSYGSQIDYETFKKQELNSQSSAYEVPSSREIRKQKVKNVEIIGGPQFTNFKTNQ